LDAQTLDNPLAPVGKLAGRRQFIRWALIPDRIVECPGFPGFSRGFEAIRSSLEAITRRIESGSVVVQAIPLSRLFEIVVETTKKDPLALLCQQDDCERCNAIRKEIE
jgi:aminoglycoside 3-N-acetyltransferase